MEETSDLIIRNGKIIDGSGGPEILSDILINDGKIKKIGKINSSINAKKEIDANGFIVTPGFVDIHTHYDGQATWDNYLSPSSWHGVTTALMGNCGVGFAPVHDHDHGRLISLMEGVEDIPDVVLTQGLEWNWNSFSDYLNILDNKFNYYHWKSNAGYGTKKHIEAIHKHGITLFHRKSFEPIKSLLNK